MESEDEEFGDEEVQVVSKPSRSPKPQRARKVLKYVDSDDEEEEEEDFIVDSDEESAEDEFSD